MRARASCYNRGRDRQLPAVVAHLRPTWHRKGHHLPLATNGSTMTHSTLVHGDRFLNNSPLASSNFTAALNSILNLP